MVIWMLTYSRQSIPRVSIVDGDAFLCKFKWNSKFRSALRIIIVPICVPLLHIFGSWLGRTFVASTFFSDKVWSGASCINNFQEKSTNARYIGTTGWCSAFFVARLRKSTETDTQSSSFRLGKRIDGEVLGVKSIAFPRQLRDLFLMELILRASNNVFM